ncbi:MAG: hypothetical protein OEV08_09670 [Nitrospira sp.]|nr:hypothetical protein [Nitrospira sp.]
MPGMKTMTALLKLAIILIAALSVNGIGRAAEDPGTRAFVQQLVRAINRDDGDARLKLMHPDAAVCASALKDAMVTGGLVPLKHRIPNDYRWSISELPAGATGFFPDKFDYSVRPTHQLQIDFDSGPNKSETMVLQVVRHGTGWREVTGCPRAKTITEAKQAAKDRGKQEARIRQLAANMAPAVKAELLRLLADGRKVDAILQYRNTSNEELAVAKGVIERLLLEKDAKSGE